MMNETARMLLLMVSRASIQAKTGCTSHFFQEIFAAFIEGIPDWMKFHAVWRVELPAGVSAPGRLAQSQVTGSQQEYFEIREGATPGLVFVRNARARHYRLTLRRDGVAVATVPA